MAYAGAAITALTGRFVKLTPFTLRMIVIDRYFDVGKARALLGYTPQVNFYDKEGWMAAVDAAVAKVEA